MDPETRESLIARLPDHADTAAWEDFVQLSESMAVLHAQAAPPDSDREFQMALRRRAFRWAARRVRQSVNESTWEAFARTAIECQSPGEVARQMGVDVGVVYLARSRVMSRLKKIVEGVSGDWSDIDSS